MAGKQLFRDGFAWLKALPLLAVTGVLAVLALMALTGAQSTDRSERERLFDFFQRLSPAQYSADEQFHTVLIDRESVEMVGPWPWPRTVLADLVTAATDAGAKGVVITEPVDSPDPLSPETIGAFWLEGASDETLARELARLPSTNSVLADAMRGTQNAIGVGANADQSPSQNRTMVRTDLDRVAWLDPASRQIGFAALPAARYFYGIDEALADAAVPGVAALTPDQDGVLRRLPLVWSLSGDPAPSLSLRAAQIAMGTDEIAVIVDASAIGSEGRIIRRISLNADEIRVARNTAMRVHLPKRIAAPSTSAARLLGDDSNSQLAGKVVFIGLDAELGGSVATARGDFPHPSLHMLAAAQIAGGNAPSRPAWAGIVESIGVMMLGAAAVMVAQKLKFWRALGFAAAISGLLVGLAFLTFTNSGLLLDPLAPALAMFVGAFSIAGGRSIGGALRDDSFRGSFHDALPEPVMKAIRENGASELLSGTRREITVLACELRIADDDLDELATTPDDVTKILASASIDLRQTIIDAGGAADQAEGGRVFAYFNAPADLADHVQAGCAAALRLIESMDKINTDLEGSSRTRGIQVHLAIGIATGPCFAGPMGHGRNNRYSAVGPAVDRAAYLRSLSEFYGPAMICDEAVYKQTHHQFAYLELDRIETRESQRPFNLYALIGNPFIKSSKGFRELDDAHRGLLAAYRSGNIDEAKRKLAEVTKSPGAKISLFDIYEERLANIEKNGVPNDWDGVTRSGI